MITDCRRGNRTNGYDKAGETIGSARRKEFAKSFLSVVRETTYSATPDGKVKVYTFINGEIKATTNLPRRH